MPDSETVKQHSDPPAPGPAEVRAQLERILASRCFEQAGRSSSFLRFVVEETLAGQGERLKGYTIGVEVFGRPVDFDAQSDPLVRVEAGRLRRRLLEYYAGEGRDDPVSIELPRGAYAAVSGYRGQKALAEVPADVLPGPMPASQGVAETQAARNRRRWRRIRTVLVAAVLLAGFAVIVLQQFELMPLGDGVGPGSAARRAADGTPPLVVTPFEALGDADRTSALAATLTEEIFLVLGEPPALVVPTEPNGGGNEHAYVLSGSVREAEAQARITARLVRGDTGAQLWSAAYDEPLTALRSPLGQRRVARLIATVAAPYGPIFDAELERTRRLGDDVLSTRDCVLLYYEYRRSFGAERYATAMRCFERATLREPTVAEAWAGFALLAADAWAHGFGGQAGNAALLERAREAARKAMDTDGRNLHANLALAAVQFFSGADFRDVAERVLSQWPESAEAQAYVGAMYVLHGETERGASLVESAIEWTPQAPSGYYASRTLVALREQRYSAALTSGLRIDAPDWALGYVIVAAAAALGGRPDLAARARERLKALDPLIETSLDDLVARWRIEPALAAELERGFAAAVH